MTDAAGNGGFEAGGRGAGAEPAVEDLTGEPAGHDEDDDYDKQNEAATGHWYEFILAGQERRGTEG